MSKIELTKQGKEILTENKFNGGEVYWLGYYGLAYVPDSSRFSPDSTALIGNGEVGDYIYNIWQGDIIGSGYAIDSISKVTLYDHNLLANYRYSYDTVAGCNRLVAWSTDGKTGEPGSVDGERVSNIRTGYHVYRGVTLNQEGNGLDLEGTEVLPVPAPLFYLGGGNTYGNPLDQEGLTAEMGADWPMTDGVYPKVTPDMRLYDGELGWDSTSERFTDVPDPADDPFGVIGSINTRARGNVKLECLDQYAKFLSVSNFNKSHGKVSSEGYGVNDQESCHNMSRVTKLFPIASYHVTKSGEPETVDGNVTERGSASAIKYHIDINLSPANQAVQACKDMLEYQSPDTNDADKDVYESEVGNSFKFNRIGIYAVQATIRHFYAEGDAPGDCRATHYQVEISPDANPVLVAVARVEEVCMSENNSFGQNRYEMDFILNIAEASETSLCTDVNVYYNLVENEAITWYQNQLIASAGLSEAVTSLQIDMAYMMNRAGITCSECSFSDDITNNDTKYGLKNLVDEYRNDGSVRGLKSRETSSSKMSHTVGVDNATYGEYCIHFGNRSTIDADGKNLLFIGGSDADNDSAPRTLITDSSNSVIIGYSGECESIKESLAVAPAGVDISSAGAEGSLLVGAGRLNNVTKMVNSIVNSWGDDIEDATDTLEYFYPSEFDNVIWYGKLKALSVLGQYTTAYEQADYRDLWQSPLKDVMVFGSPTGDTGAYTLWIGRDARLCSVYKAIMDYGDETLCTIPPSDILQPYCTPMIFTGGLGIGGHYVQGGETLHDDYGNILDYYQAGMYGLIKLGVGYSDTNTALNEDTLHRNTKSTVVSVAGNNLLIRGHQIAGDGAFDPIRLVGGAISGHNTGHYVVHSPHAMKPLISAEYQELDGTLHIGLGQNPIHGDDGTVIIWSSYITSGISFSLQLSHAQNQSITRTLSIAAPAIEESASGTLRATDDYTGIGITADYRWDDRGASGKYLTFSNTTLHLPSDRPRTYAFNGTWNDTNGYVSYLSGAKPVINIESCLYLNNSNMHVYIKNGEFFFGEMPKMQIPGLGFADSAAGFYCSPKTVNIAEKTLYRLSAVAYRNQHGYYATCSHYPRYIGGAESYPMRVEVIPIDENGVVDVETT